MANRGERRQKRKREGDRREKDKERRGTEEGRWMQIRDGERRKRKGREGKGSKIVLKEKHVFISI